MTLLLHLFRRDYCLNQLPGASMPVDLDDGVANANLHRCGWDVMMHSIASTGWLIEDGGEEQPRYTEDLLW